MNKVCLTVFFGFAILAVAAPSDDLKACDKNADKVLDAVEFKVAVKKNPSFAKFDKNADGTLDREEMAAALTELATAEITIGGEEKKDKKGKKVKK